MVLCVALGLPLSSEKEADSGGVATAGGGAEEGAGVATPPPAPPAEGEEEDEEEDEEEEEEEGPMKTPGFEFPATPEARLAAVHQMLTETPLVDG